MLAQIESAARVQTETESASANSHRVEYDVMTDMIRVTASGFWTPDELRANMRKTERVLQRVRGAGRQVRVLVDLRESQVQSRETADHNRAGVADLYRPDERVAIVFAGGLQALQVKRVKPDSPNHRAFGSIAEAEAWLLV